MGSEKLDEYASVGRTVVRQGIKVGGKRGGRAAQGALASGKTAAKHVATNKPGKGEAIGSLVGSVAGGIGGGVAGAPLGGVGAIATGVAGGEVGERIGGAIGKKFDNKKLPPVKKESFSDWRNDLGEEGYDRMRDDRLVKYGIGHDGSDSKPSIKRTPDNQKIKGKTVLQKETEKKYGKGATAMDVVKAKIKAGKL